MTAQTAADSLRQNADDFWSHRMPEAAFRAAQRATWAAVEAAGISKDVLALLRA